MTDIERLLNEEKDKLDKLEIPDDIESRLRDTLYNIPKKKKRIQGRIAAIIIILLLGYNIDTLAYYGKKLIGYENVMNGTLQELNELGKGQIINKSYTFNDGAKVILDGVMLDDNNMIIFYTINAPNGDVQRKGTDMNVYISGLLDKEYTYSGQGNVNEDKTMMKWVLATHDAPKFYERTIDFKIDYRHKDGNTEHGEISFKLDRSQAVGKSLQISINKKIQIDSRSLKVESLVASPTKTVIKGQIQDIIELGIDYLNKDRFRPESLEMVLLADGKEVQLQGLGMSTDMDGVEYDIRFDALPEDTKVIELKLVSFGGDHDVDEVIALAKGETKKINILGQGIEINKIYEEENNTYITFTTEENVSLSRVHLIIDGVREALQETIPGEHKKTVEGDSAKIYYTRTMRFNNSGDKLELDVQRIRYNKSYDKTIYSYTLD